MSLSPGDPGSASALGGALRTQAARLRRTCHALVGREAPLPRQRPS
jgi:hypothetical protein